MSPHVLGVDGGGTKTVAALVDADGRPIAIRQFATLDPSIGDGWRDELARIAAFAAQPAGHLQAAVLGLPLHGEIAAYSQAQLDSVARLFPAGAVVENDVRVAFDGAFACGPGALILSGTGSMAWASLGGSANRHVRVGGWGELFGDEGSSYWIGREALALASRHLDGRTSAAAFAEGLLAAIGVGPTELAGWCYGLPNRRAGVARLAAFVDAFAEKGDPDAIALLRRAADELANQLETAWRLCDGGPVMRWSYAGGAFRSRRLAELMIERIGSPPIGPRLPPIGGAVIRAAQLAGWPTNEGWIARLADSVGDWR